MLVLIDADEDPPCILGPQLLNLAMQARRDGDVSCVVANVEYEIWFVAAAESLGEYLELQESGSMPERPEERRLGKGWIQKHFRGPGTKYSETIDQPAMTAVMDIELCRSRSPSFDKFCRDLERRLRPD